MKDKISVIIPIYKVEKYLNRCVESVVNQTYRNLEIILVDDGSPDKCPEICEEWAKKDKRIRVIHKENGGLSDARNVGHRMASGEYIAFVDSDDWIHKDALETLKCFLERYNADIVECKAFSTNKKVDDKIIDRDKIVVSEFDRESSMRALLREEPLRQTVWNKLFKRTVIKDIDFKKGKYHEDEFWTYQVFDKAKKILFLDVVLYYYFQRLDSIMGQAFSLRRLDAIEGRYRRFLYIQDKFPELEAYTKENLLFLIMYYGQQALKAADTEKRIFFKEIEKYLKKIDVTDEDKKGYSFLNKFWIKACKKNVLLTCMVRNLLKIGM